MTTLNSKCGKIKRLNLWQNSKVQVFIKMKTGSLTDLDKKNLIPEKIYFWQEVFWLEQLDTSKMDDMYSGSLLQWWYIFISSFTSATLCHGARFEKKICATNECFYGPLQWCENKFSLNFFFVSFYKKDILRWKFKLW